MSLKSGRKGYVKTAIFFTTYDESVATEILDRIKERYKVIESHRSKVLREIYYVAVEGNAKDVEDLLRSRVEWFKVDVLTFK